MPTSTFSVRMDRDLKTKLDELCAGFGMNASVAINIFARAVVRERRIPFEITAEAANPGLRAFQKLRRQAEVSGVQGMSLDKINAEISASRKRS